MPKRYIGDAVIDIRYDDRHQDYRGTITAGRHKWKFDGLHEPRMGFGSVDSPSAYDQMAVSAASFASYYTSDNRGDDLPEWAPKPSVADAIADALSPAIGDPQGRYEVQRTPSGPIKLVG